MSRVLLLALCLGAVGLFLARGSAAQQPVLVSPVIGQDDGNDRRVDIRVDGVSNLGAFEFVLAFDKEIVSVDRVEKGDFLSSSGREVLCIDPTIETGAVQYKCVTLGGEPSHGSDGSGVLASIFFVRNGSGKTSIELSHVKLADPAGSVIDSQVQGASLQISGGDGKRSLWLFVLGGGVLVVVLVVAGGVLLARRKRAVGSP